MLPPDRPVRAGISWLPCIGDGRQSWTSASPSILNESPDAAAGAWLVQLRDCDRISVGIGRRRSDALVHEQEWAAQDPR